MFWLIEGKLQNAFSKLVCKMQGKLNGEAQAVMALCILRRTGKA